MTDPVETLARVLMPERSRYHPDTEWNGALIRARAILAQITPALVAEAVAQEREACAETAYQAAMRYEGTPLGQASDGIAAAIRARKQT